MKTNTIFDAPKTISNEQKNTITSPCMVASGESPATLLIECRTPKHGFFV